MPHSLTELELEASWSPKVTRLHVTVQWSALVKLFARVRGKSALPLMQHSSLLSNEPAARLC